MVRDNFDNVGHSWVGGCCGGAGRNDDDDIAVCIVDRVEVSGSIVEEYFLGSVQVTTLDDDLRSGNGLCEKAVPVGWVDDPDACDGWRSRRILFTAQLDEAGGHDDEEGY